MNRDRLRSTGLTLRRLCLAVAAWMSLVLVVGSAQPRPIMVTVNVVPPYSPDLSVWEAHPERVLVLMTNVSGESQTVRIAGFVENLDGSIRLETRLSVPATCMTIAPGGVRTMTLADFRLFNSEAVRITGADRDVIARTRRLPEGMYRLCVVAVDCRTLDTLSNPAPAGCTNFNIRYVEPPIPIAPRCSQTVRAVSPQLVQLQWTVPAGAPAGTQYEVTMVELPKGWDAEYALRAATKPVYFQRITTAPLLLYGPAEPALQEGLSYAWRVRAIDRTQAVTFRNDGYSPACWFLWQGSETRRADSIGRLPIIPPPLPSRPTTPAAPPVAPSADTLATPRMMPFDIGAMRPTGCISIVAVDGDPLDEVSGTPSFRARVSPAIDLAAVTGGMVQVWETSSRVVDPYGVGADASRAVFTERFSGKVPGALEAIREKRGSTLLRLRFAEGRFMPRPRQLYVWRFTLEFDGGRIREDGVSCRSTAAASTFGRFPDLAHLADLPDTLVAGAFTIVVEEYDTISRSSNPALPSGVGRVRFDCDRAPSTLPWLELGTFRPREFGVVSTVSDSSSQLHLMEAAVIDPGASVGDRIALPMPEAAMGAQEQLRVRESLLDFFRSHARDGIRVHFHDIRWTGPRQPKVTLVEGEASYPSSPASPSPPAIIEIDSGFSIALDTFWLSTTAARFQGALLLPIGIISDDSCTRARLPIAWTDITPDCNCYYESAEGYGPWHIGETGLTVVGSGYAIDFSESRSPSGITPMLMATWRGVVLRSGGTVAPPVDSVISNRGYVKAQYRYDHAFITRSGFAGRLDLESAFTYHALDPFGYAIELGAGWLTVASSAIESGTFTSGTVNLPMAAVRNGSMGRVSVPFTALTVQPDQDLFASMRVRTALLWGELSRTARNPRFFGLERTSNWDSAYFYLGARHLGGFYPTDDTTFKAPTHLSPQVAYESQRMQGVTLPSMLNHEFSIFTLDVPDTLSMTPLRFAPEEVSHAWLNIGRTGVHSEIRILRTTTGRQYSMGPVWARGPAYAGITSFSVSFRITPAQLEQKQERIMRFQFVESSVWRSELRGSVKLAAPASTDVEFSDMMFTSTAQNAGGQVDLSMADTLSHWGVELVPKDPTASAGIVCVRLGVIYLTAAGIREARHFDRPFFLTWGEILANGNVGRLAFDFNNVGQRFDRFPFAPTMVALSPVTAVELAAGIDTGWVQTFGSVSIGFFGARLLSISDFKTRHPSLAPSPFDRRYVRVPSYELPDAPASDLHWTRDWAEGVGSFDYRMVYDSLKQDGFLGAGTATIANISGSLPSTISVRAEGSCFRIVEETSHAMALGGLTNFSSVGNIWGCGCITGETLAQIVAGGEMSASGGAGFSLVAQGAGMVSVLFSYTPTRSVTEFNGSMYAVLVTVNAEVSGLASFVVDRGEDYVEGYLKGTIALESILSGIRGEGELDWHIGADFLSIQGRVKVAIYGTFSSGIEAGAFLGVNTPRDRIWVTDGISGRFAFNKGALPDRVTGIYAFLAWESSIDLFIISGGYQVYVGTGAFMGTGETVGFGFGVIGNLGLRIWGEILGGLVSASAWGNIQMVAGIPPAFQGSVGLEACVLWVICGSVEIGCGYNYTDGFYLY